MKHTIAYVAYFLVAAIVTNFVAFIFNYMISGILFYAADVAPGDISVTAKLIFSVVLPVVYAFVLFVFYKAYAIILESFNIQLKTMVGVLFHILIALYLIWKSVPVTF